MKKLSGLLFLVAFTVLIIFEGHSKAVLRWSWEFGEPGSDRIVGPTETVVMNAVLYNHNSDENLFDWNLRGLRISDYSEIQRWYDFKFGPPGIDPVDWPLQFAEINLAPFESFDFVFGIFVPKGGQIPIGTYHATTGISMDSLDVAIPPKYEIEMQISVAPPSFYDDNDFDGVDLAVFSAAYGSGVTESPNYNPDPDFSVDGDVDDVDLGAFSVNFGKTNLQAPTVVREGQI